MPKSRIAPFSNRIIETKVTVGTSGVLVSAASGSKMWTMLEADKANAANLLYFGATTGVTTASGFGELAAGEVLTIPGGGAICAVSGAAAQSVRVLVGMV